MAATETQLMLSVGLIGKFFIAFFEIFCWFSSELAPQLTDNHMIPV